MAQNGGITRNESRSRGRGRFQQVGSLVGSNSNDGDVSRGGFFFQLANGLANVVFGGFEVGKHQEGTFLLGACEQGGGVCDSPDAVV